MQPCEFIANGKIFEPKLPRIQNLQTSQDYIFRILEHCTTTELCNSTNLRILFLAVVEEFVLLAYIEG